MFLSDMSVRRPVTTTMMSLAILVFGALGLQRLGISLFPQIDIPTVTVSTEWPAASPEEVESQITREIEDAVGTIEGIKHIRSTNSEGLSVVTIEFELFRDIDIAAQDVRDKVATKSGVLPADAEVPLIQKLDINANPIIWIAISGTRSLADITEFADKTLRPRIQQLPGVGSVRLGGDRERKVRIWLEREKLLAHDLTASDVVQAVVRKNVEIPGGKLQTEERDVTVKTKGRIETPRGFNDLVVAFRNGTAVRLEDLGWSEDGMEDLQSTARFNIRIVEPGGEVSTRSLFAVALGVATQSGANDVAVATAVKDFLADVEGNMPAGMRLNLAADSSVFIEQSIDQVFEHLFEGGILAVVIILFFLQNFGTTLISALAIPLSIIGTFALMFPLGFTLNNMTMLGLTIMIGVVIDDAIIVIETVYRKMEEGQDRMSAALEGTREIAFAAAAATFSLVAVFLPVAFMEGFVGQLFFEFGVTVAVSLVISLFVALTTVPMLASRFLRVSEKQNLLFRVFDAMVRGLTRVYKRSLDFVLRFRWTSLLVGLAALVGGAASVPSLGVEFQPEEDQGRLLVNVQTPTGYSVERTDGKLAVASEKMLELPEISHFFSAVGLGAGGRGDANKGIMFATLVPLDQRQRSQQEVMVELRRTLNTIPDLRAQVSSLSMLGGGTRSAPLQVTLQGSDLNRLGELSEELISRLDATPGIVDLDRDLELGKSEVHIRIDRDRAADLGVDLLSIADAIGILVGGRDVSTFKDGGENYDVKVRLLESDRRFPVDLRRITVRTSRGEALPLDALVTLERTRGPSVISRLDRQRAVTVFANLEGVPLGEAQAKVVGILGRILPDGYTYQWAGTSEMLGETLGEMLFAIVLAIVLTYMILASQFESFLHPFIIMFSLPLAVVGAIGAMFLMGMTINMYSFIGFVLLVGLVTKNSILLIDYTNQLRAEGMTADEALRKAGPVRLRPILMTAISMIFGVLPVALGFGVGSETRQPMAVATAGGMISSTLLTLLIIPALYSLLEGFKDWWSTKEVSEPPV